MFFFKAECDTVFVGWKCNVTLPQRATAMLAAPLNELNAVCKHAHSDNANMLMWSGVNPILLRYLSVDESGGTNN